MPGLVVAPALTARGGRAKPPHMWLLKMYRVG